MERTNTFGSVVRLQLQYLRLGGAVAPCAVAVILFAIGDTTSAPRLKASKTTDQVPCFEGDDKCGAAAEPMQLSWLSLKPE